MATPEQNNPEAALSAYVAALPRDYKQRVGPISLSPYTSERKQYPFYHYFVQPDKDKLSVYGKGYANEGDLEMALGIRPSGLKDTLKATLPVQIPILTKNESEQFVLGYEWGVPTDDKHPEIPTLFITETIGEKNIPKYGMAMSIPRETAAHAIFNTSKEPSANNKPLTVGSSFKIPGMGTVEIREILDEESDLLKGMLSTVGGDLQEIEVQRELAERELSF